MGTKKRAETSERYAKDCLLFKRSELVGSKSDLPKAEDTGRRKRSGESESKTL